MPVPNANLVAQWKWFHSIDLGNGVVTPGLGSLKYLEACAEIYFRDGIASKSVLDVGCWDGFNSFAAMRRGARRVLATDHLRWAIEEDGWGGRRPFEYARQHIAPQVEALDIELHDLIIDRVGTFDVVLFCGIFYHLRNPFLVLEQMAKLTTEMLIVETHLDAMDNERPAMIFYPTRELNDDKTNWWGPNRLCVEAMLRDVGLKKIEFVENPSHATRGIFFGTK